MIGDDDALYIGAHLQGVQTPRRVAAGEVIGTVGTTGTEVATPHLHLEVHPDNGAPMNPYPLLKAACR